MVNWTYGDRYWLRILEKPEEMAAVESLQRIVWPGNETEIVPVHLLMAAAHNGGLVIGAYYVAENIPTDPPPQSALNPQVPPDSPLVGFVFGFPGLYPDADKQCIKHCSHMLGVLPDHRDQGIGFALKRAQWQMVRHQRLDLITWTYDPLLSRNAHLNISRLGAVCNTYRRDEYGELQDSLNLGLPTDRFQVNWWINSQRVFQRLSKQARLRLDLAHFLAAEAVILNPTHLGVGELAIPDSSVESRLDEIIQSGEMAKLVLIEIPADFQAIKTQAPQFAYDWRMHTRFIFEELFQAGYLITDFVFLPGKYPRSFYVASHGETTL